MKDKQIHPRKPLTKIRRELHWLALHRLENFTDSRFDMGRVVKTDDPEDAIKLAYIEHLLRATTPRTEVEDAYNSMAISLAASLRYLSSALNRDTFLEDLISTADLETLAMPDLALHMFTNSGHHLKELRLFADSTGPVCHVYICLRKYSCVILYTVEMSVIDGFCPISGKKKKYSLTPEAIQLLADSLYATAKRRNTVSETIKTLNYQKNFETRSESGASEVPVSVTSSNVSWRKYDIQAKYILREREKCGECVLQ